MKNSLDRIKVNPNVCLGQPTIRGMRITVSFVLKLMASGMTHTDILKSYPELEEEDLHQTLDYAAWVASESHRPLDVLTEKA